MLTFGRRVSAAVLAVTLSAAHAAVCAGWLPTPEARMACCADEDACPMHQADSQGSLSARAVTQAEADICCAASERDPASAASAYALLVALAPAWSPATVHILPTSAPPDTWRTLVPPPGTPVPRHLLLAVLIV